MGRSTLYCGRTSVQMRARWIGSNPTNPSWLFSPNRHLEGLRCSAEVAQSCGTPRRHQVQHAWASHVLQDQGRSASFVHELSCQEQMMRMKRMRAIARDGNARNQGPKQQMQTVGAHSSISGLWDV